MFPSYTTLGPLPEMALSFIAVIESENPLNPYVQSWTASMERELGRSTSLEVNYIGTHSIHLLDRREDVYKRQSVFQLPGGQGGVEQRVVDHLGDCLVIK